MGLNLRKVQRLHKLRDDVTDNVPNRERVEQNDKKLNASNGAYDVMRGIRSRQGRNFGFDSLDRKIELAWEVEAVVDRFDFGGADFGLRITLPSSAQGDDRGFKNGDEIRIMQKNSVLAALRFRAVEEANSGDVAANKVRLVSNTVWRLKDINPFTTESNVTIRVELDAGPRTAL